jgi:hypothetical protein
LGWEIYSYNDHCSPPYSRACCLVSSTNFTRASKPTLSWNQLHKLRSQVYRSGGNLCSGMWLLKNSFGVFALKIRHARMPYKTIFATSGYISGHPISAVSAIEDFFYSHACSQQQRLVKTGGRLVKARTVLLALIGGEPSDEAVLQEVWCGGSRCCRWRRDSTRKVSRAESGCSEVGGVWQKLAPNATILDCAAVVGDDRECF